MENYIIKNCEMKNLQRYGEIYASAFSGEPWNDPWKAEDASIHVKEIMENPHSHCLECCIDGKTVGLILGTSMLFHYGRTFEINDLAVDPDYQNKGIAKKLIEQCLKDAKEHEIVGVNLITASDGFLPKYYEKYGFPKKNRVILMGKELKQ